MTVSNSMFPGKIINPEPLFFDEKLGPDVIVDCRGALIAPGFIDLQINGGFGVDFSVDIVDDATAEECVTVVARGVLEHGKTKVYTTLQSVMNTKLSKHRFWHCHENGSSKTILTIPHNL